MRETQVYISFEVRNLLTAIAKSRGLTADLVADQLLREIIYKNYPQAKTLVAKMADLKQELIESFKNDQNDNSESIPVHYPSEQAILGGAPGKA
jgi:hypothetical protein